jgi:signal transduction histidine kinase
MSTKENIPVTGSTPSDSTGGQTAPADQTIADLKNELAFTKKKLQIVGNVTRHDVLNQLTAIIGFNELLRMMVQDPKLKNYIEKEKLAIDQIQRQFQFAKDFQNIAVDPPRWQNIRNLVSIVGEDCELHGTRIVVDTGDAALLADPLLEKVFQYLFENALCHGEKVTEIRISLVVTGAGGILLVENNGTGIPGEEKSRIFERGYGSGAGWGLFLAREILAVTGMTIMENGDPEKGLRFEITLPPGTFELNVGEPPGL